MKKFRPIAVHLPQFHPIPENDEWWGKGFTEWTNVSKAKPLFKDHYQPHLPADLGFYDLRLKEARLEQEKLAKEYGIFGFCYYHYWFNGKLLLQTPIEQKLKNPEENLPFMLCWANENWTRIWDGGANNILMEQEYNLEDHIKHLHYLLPYFKDERYIKIDGKSVFAIYRSTNIPDFDQVCELWKTEARKEGVELYIIRFESFGEGGEQFMTPNVDAAAEFQPHKGLRFAGRPKPKIYEQKENHKTLREEISYRTVVTSIYYRYHRIKKMLESKKKKTAKATTRRWDYEDFVKKNIEYDKENMTTHKVYGCVCPGFDNSARKTEGYFSLTNSNPDLFKKWLTEKLALSKIYSPEENLFFINAWNEWAEGNHLEPDRKWGRKFLEKVRETF